MKQHYNRFCIPFLALALLAGIPVAAAEDGHGHDHGTEEHEGEEHAGHSDEVTITAEARRTFNIELGTAVSRILVETGTVPARVTYNGEAMAHVGVPLSGRASEIHVKLGDVVAKGDLLAIVESPELGKAESDLLQSSSLMVAAEGAVEVARIAFQRAEELRKTNTVSVSEFLERQGELKKAEGELKVAEASRQAAENHLHILGLSEDQVDRLVSTGEVSSRFELRAPIAGTIVQREVTPGEVVGPDREELMVIADMATLWVLADVPERLAHRVAIKSRGRITLGFMEDAEIEGIIDYVAPELNPRTRTAQVRLVVHAGDQPVVHPAQEEHAHADHEGHDHEAHEELGTEEHGDHEGHDHGSEKESSGEEGHDHAGHEHEQEAGPNDHEGHDHAHESEQPEEDGHDHENHDESAGPGTQTVGALLKPGMFVEVELELGTSGTANSTPMLFVPEEAIQTVEGKESVFVPADEPNTFTPRPVTIGRRVNGFVPVISGLKEGDAYVVTGSFILKAELGKAGAEHVH